MIVLFTDFGFEGPYVGQMKGVLASRAAGVPVIDLMHAVPSYDARAAAYLLARLADEFPRGTVFCAVVDPGVGSARPPVYLWADGRHFVGPGNGLFEIVRRRAADAREARLALQPERLSASFHGRDLFSPAAAMLAMGEEPPAEPLGGPLPGRDWPDDLPEIIYADRFGNAMTGLRASALSASATLEVAGRRFARARTFSDVPVGAGFWYENSNGLAEIAVNQASAVDALGLKVGSGIKIIR